MLEIKKITKAFAGKKVVDDVSFTVKTGEAYGLLGPNGAGKSTTINMLAGLFKPDAGQITIAGYDLVNEKQKAQSCLGIVPQDIALYQEFSAEYNLRFWGSMYNISSKLLTERIEEVLDIIGLSDRRKDKVETFSGGMKRRVNIGCALLHKPQLLIMDEPTVGIDPQSRNHILEMVKQFNKQGMTVLYTSHYMEEVQQLCEKVAIMDHGKLLLTGNIQAIIAEHENCDNLESVFLQLTGRGLRDQEG